MTGNTINRRPARMGAALAAMSIGTLMLAGAPYRADAATQPDPASVVVSGATPFAACADASRVPNTEFEPWLATRPHDPRRLAVGWQQDRSTTGAARGGIVVATSRDAGRTWAGSPLPGLTKCSGGTFTSTSNPAVAYATDGRLFAVAMAMSFGNVTAVLAYRSDDDGSTWTGPAALTQDPSPAYFNDRPSVTTDPRSPSRAYVVWNRARAEDNQHQLMFSRTLDGGVTWEPARPIYEPADAGAGTVGNQIVVEPNGDLVELFYEGDFPVAGPPTPALASRIRSVRSTDGGTTWSAPVTVTTTVVNDPLLPDVTSPVSARGLIPDIAVDRRTGALYAVWGDGSLATSRSSIGLSASFDGGRHWTRPIRVDKSPQSPPGGAGQAFLPQVDVDDDGNVAVTYHDFRNNTPDPGAPTDVWMVTCRSLLCAGLPGLWRERHLAGPFDIEKAATWSGAPFLGTSVGLGHTRAGFYAALVLTNDTPDNPQDIHVVRAPSP
ncbi:sialidase family protein [Sphaerisporangium corydalis]|uniref:exo-alpha-sialidase n=1 Tax=Sphaerisporangium corydalis TaxID=1441875 RepID=A0ABV9EEY7_9ACTN|nr:sialidase family protein [Sphaerisporangium corydalis]